MIVDPYDQPDRRVSDALALMERYRISASPSCARRPARGSLPIATSLELRVELPSWR